MFYAYQVGSRPRQTFQLRLPNLRTKPALGNALLFQFSQLQLRCSTSISGLQVSPLLSDQQRTSLIFAEQIEIFQVKAWLATFKARNANLKLLDYRRKKKKKKRWLD